MRSIYDLAEEARKKCGTRFSPIEYALSRSNDADNEVMADLWKRTAELLKEWK